MATALPLPKYHQIYLVLRERLHEGAFDQGLPGEMALMQQFGVARVTVRRALEKLSAEGLIERRPGRGTTRSQPARPASAALDDPSRHPGLNGLLGNLVDMSLATSVQVVSCDTLPAPDAVADALQLDRGSPVQKAVRVRSTGEGPLSYITTWVPQPLAESFGARELASKPILVLLEASGVRVGRATQTVSARLADAEVARHLQVAVGSALLAVTRRVFDQDERPVQWLHGLYRPDRYQYQMQLSRVGEIDAKVWVSEALGANFH
jgi:GntR family transcriptional regulator